MSSKDNPNKTMDKVIDPHRKKIKKKKQRNIDPQHALHDMSKDVDPLNFNLFSDLLFGDPHIDDGNIRIFIQAGGGDGGSQAKDNVVVTEIKGDS